MNNPLFISKNETLTTQMFVDKLKPYIQKGDVIYIEIDVMTFGKLADALISKKEFLKKILTIFETLIGNEGTLVLPTFSYSWGSTRADKFFDINKTKGEVGIFPEYVRKLTGTKRSLDPMFSVVARGKYADDITDIEYSSFGKGSAFEKLHKYNAKLISFGLSQFDPTFVHYIEEVYSRDISAINYRLEVEFNGLFQHEKCEQRHFCYMRPLDSTLIFTDKNIKKDLISSGDLASIKLGASNIYISDTNSMFEQGIKGISGDINYFVQEER